MQQATEMRNVYTILVGKPEGKNHIGHLRADVRLTGPIKLCFRELGGWGWGEVEWIQDKVQRGLL
jgi:hypothetical protein